MVLREATHDDIPTLVALIRTAFEEYRGRLQPPSGAHRETAESIGNYLQQGYAVFAVLNPASVLRTPGLPRGTLRGARGLHYTDFCGHGEAGSLAMCSTLERKRYTDASRKWP